MAAEPDASVSALVEACARGESGAWELFVGRFGRIVGIAVLRTLSASGVVTYTRDARADLTQEVWLRLVANDRRALREFRGSTELALHAYLARVARSVVLDELRSRGAKKRAWRLVSIDDQGSDPEERSELSLPANESSQPDRIYVETSQRALVGETLRRILTGRNADRDLVIMQLYLFEELTSREIAALPGFELGAQGVESVVNRSRARLREVLGGDDRLSRQFPS